MSRFVYQLDDRRTQLPWARPAFERLRFWFLDIVRELDFANDPAEFFVAGGGWSTHADGAAPWDLDLFLVAHDPIDTMRQDRLCWLSELMSSGTWMGIERHRLLLDITLVETTFRLDEVHKNILAFEQKPSRSLPAPPPVDMGYGVFGFRRKVIDDVEQFAEETWHEHKRGLPNGRTLYQKRFKSPLQKQMSHIRAGRVYHPPVRLLDLID